MFTLGHEGSGLSDEVLGRCDQLISINNCNKMPSNGQTSLNVSVATGILFCYLEN